MVGIKNKIKQKITKVSSNTMLALKFNLPKHKYSYMRRVAGKQGWRKIRTQRQNKIDAKVEVKLINKRASEIVKLDTAICDVLDRLSGKYGKLSYKTTGEMAEVFHKLVQNRQLLTGGATERIDMSNKISTVHRILERLGKG